MDEATPPLPATHKEVEYAIKDNYIFINLLGEII